MRSAGTPALSKEGRAARAAKARDYVLMGYMLMTATDIVLRRSQRLMEALRPGCRYNDAWRLGQGMAALEGVLKRMEVLTEGTESRICELAKGEAFAGLRRNANELLRFALAFYDRTMDDMAATERFNDLIRELPSSGVFPDEETDTFRMQ